jgi:hypothetical protein
LTASATCFRLLAYWLLSPCRCSCSSRSMVPGCLDFSFLYLFLSCLRSRPGKHSAIVAKSIPHSRKACTAADTQANQVTHATSPVCLCRLQCNQLSTPSKVYVMQQKHRNTQGLPQGGEQRNTSGVAEGNLASECTSERRPTGNAFRLPLLKGPQGQYAVIGFIMQSIEPLNY